MKISISKIIIFTFVIFFLLVFWRGLKINNNYDTKNLIGKKISKFQLIEIDNNNRYISEEDLKQNKYTLINFFASWCAPCRTEHEYLLNLSNENQKIKIIGINFKDKKNNAINFLNRYGNPYDELAKDELGKKSVNFGVYGIPESILVNKDLVIIKKFIGPLSNKDYKLIQKIIK